MPVIVKIYNGNAYASAHEADEISGTLKAKGGSLCGMGGGETLIVETLVFDEGQITCPTNGLNPKWGGYATPCPGTPGER